jgi:acetyl-CoA carboxylase carboxyl transferase subunit alpha
MGITANRLYEAELIDYVIDEPLGGAHRQYDEITSSVKQRLLTELSTLKQMSSEELVSRRQNRIRSYGVYRTDK